MINTIILGSAGNCLDILDIIADINNVAPQYKCIGFLDDDPAKQGRSVHGVKVLGTLSEANKFENCSFVNGIGSPLNFWKKESIINKTQIPINKFVTLTHPSAFVSRLSKIGKGTVIFQNVTIRSNTSIGHHVIVLPNSGIGHDDQIGDYTCIASGACISGGTRIGKSCYVGSNSSVIGNVNIGNNCLIGIGSNVLNNVNDNSVMVGNPAKYMRKTKTG